MKKSLFLGILLFLTPMAAFATTSIPSELKFCDDEDTWPPYLKYRYENEEKTKNLEGYSYDVVKVILDKQHIKFSIDMLPWKRCLQSGEIGEYSLVLNAMSTPERAKNYLISDTFYNLTGVYIYPKSRPAPIIEKPADLKKYNICGLFGYDYQPFGLADTKIDQGSKNFDQVVKKIESHRCDLLIGHYEIMGERSKASGKSIFENSKFGYAKIPQMSPVPFVMLISRHLPYSEQLHKLINQGLKSYLNSPEDKKLKKKWGIGWD